MEVCVPGSMQGVAIAVPLHLSRKEDGNFIFFVELIRCYVMLVLNYAFQLFLLMQIWTAIEGDKEDECKDELFPVQIACVFIFQSSVFSELLDTVDLFSLLYHAEKKGKGRLSLSSPREPHGAVMAHESRYGFLKRFRPSPPPDMPQWKLDDINVCYKLWSTLVVALPKLLIAIALSYIGGLFIARNKSVGDIVLNTLAVNFVFDLNTILYACFIQQTVKDSIEHMESVEISVNNTHRFLQWLITTTIFPLLVVAATFYIVVFTEGCGMEYMPTQLHGLVSQSHDSA